MAQMIKSLPAVQETQVPSPGSGRSLGEGTATRSVFLPGKSHGWRSLEGYSPWGHKELDTTEPLHFHLKYFSR